MKVRFVEPVGTRAVLRIYWGKGCSKYGYHNASKPLKDSKMMNDQIVGGTLDQHQDRSEWPTKCDGCGEPVPEGHFLNHDGKFEERPQYQVFHRTLWSSGLDHLEPGDLWYSTSHVRTWDNDNDPRGHLFCMLPNGHTWDIDSRASNCTRKDDRTHRCWIRHGEPPNVHVDKNGDTCSAGAGSILVEGWHGFLHNGELIQC